MSSEKRTARLRRAKRARSKISELRKHRLCVYRSPRHIYAQIIAPTGSQVLASASTVEKEGRSDATGNIEAAGKVPPPSLLSAPRPQVLKKLHLIVPDTPTMAGSRPWLRLHGKVDYSFNRESVYSLNMTD